MPATPPTLVCLHFLGGSAQSWRWVAERLGGAFEVLAVDLPGFGDAAGTPGNTVSAMADHVARLVAARAPQRWQLAGHSLGAKVAAVLARRAEDGEAGLAGLEALTLVAGSPPGPEPMKASERRRMKTWFDGDAASRLADARSYIDGNVGAALPADRRDALVAEVLRMDRAAWLAWLDGGSHEDWADRVGVLQTPALVITGSQDPELGEAAQRKLTLPHLARGRLVNVPGAGHLLPIERPDDVAALIAGVVPVPAAYRALIGSRRVSTRTREVLLARLQPDTATPDVLDASQMAILRALVERVLPQPGPGRIDLAVRMAATLEGPGDGWRFADLPPDTEAWRAGLDTLDGLGFVALDGGKQDALLEAVAAGKTPGKLFGARPLSAAQMKLWFQDVAAEAVRHYVAHPATLARMGYSGIGYGGDGPEKAGFVRIGVGERDDWEPVAP